MLAYFKKIFFSPSKIPFAHQGNMVKVEDGVTIDHPEFVSIGNNVRIKKGSMLLVNAARGKFEHGSIEIGENSLLSFNTIIFAGHGSIKIGAHCELGLNCRIVAQKRILSRKEAVSPDGLQCFTTEVGDECLFGTGATVLEGSKIGNKCVIGAGAVVQGTYPDNTTLIGNPARAIPSIR